MQEFDRELEQFLRLEKPLAERVAALEAKMDETRDGGDLLEDFARYREQWLPLKNGLTELRKACDQYKVDRDRLSEWSGNLDEWIVAGSIFGLRVGGSIFAYVLTQRAADSEYTTLSYESPLGKAVRRKKVGAQIRLPDGQEGVVEWIRPGFRKRPGSTGEGPPTGQEPESWLASQRCSDPVFRADMLARRTEPHIRKINEYVDELRSIRNAHVPYLAPTYGGRSAQLLTLYQDPGPKTDVMNSNGSGMLCIENADFSAARAKYFLEKSGIRISQTVSWNAYPWPKPHPQTQSSDNEAAEALQGFLALAPSVQVVVLNGSVAKKIWSIYAANYPQYVKAIHVFTTFHPSPRAIDPAARSNDYIRFVNDDIFKKYQEAARVLRSLN